MESYSVKDLLTSIDKDSVSALGNVVKALNSLQKACQASANTIKSVDAEMTAVINWQNTFDGVSESCKKDIEAISDALSMLTSNDSISQVTTMVKQFAGSVKEVSSKAESFGKVIGTSFNTAKEKCGTFIKALPDNLFKKVQEKATVFGDKIGEFSFRFSALTGRFEKDTPKMWKSINTLKTSFQETIEKCSIFAKALPGNAFNKVKEKAIAFGDKVGEISFKFRSVTGGFEKDAPKIWKIFDFLKGKVGSLIGAISTIGKKVAGGVSFISKLFSINLSKIASAIGLSIKKGMGLGVSAMKSSLSAMASVMSLALKAVGPAAVLGIALVGIGALQGEFGTQITSIIQTVATKGPEIISEFVNSIVSNIPQLAATGSQILVSLLNALTANLPAVFTGGMQILTSLIEGVISNLPQIIPAVISLITVFMESIISALPEILLLGLLVLQSLMQGVIDNIDLIMESVTSIISSIVTGISENLPQILEAGVTLLSMLIDGIVQNLPMILDTVNNLIVTLVSGIIENLPQILAAGVEIICALVLGLAQMLPTLPEKGLELIQSLGQGIVDAIPNIKSAVENIKNTIRDTIKELAAPMVDWGKDLIKGLRDGIMSGMKMITDAVGNIADKIKGLLHFSRPDEGPLRSYEQWMPDFMKGLARGITRNVGLIENAVSKVVDTMDIAATMQIAPTVGAADFAGVTGRGCSMYGNMSVNPNVQSVGDIMVNFVDEMRDLLQNPDNRFVIEVPIELEGRQIAKATAPYTQDELNKIGIRNSRKKGYR